MVRFHTTFLIEALISLLLSTHCFLFLTFFFFHNFVYSSLSSSFTGTTTGISAHDRALTVRQLISPRVHASDFSRPGHMVPLRAREGGVLTRMGHTEAGVDLCRMTGQAPGGVLCELVNDDLSGSMARRDDCRAFADRWGLKMVSIEMLADWRRRHESSNWKKAGGGYNIWNRRKTQSIILILHWICICSDTLDYTYPISPLC